MTPAVARLHAYKHFVLLGALVAALVTQPLVAHESAAARLGYDLLVAVVVGAVFLVAFSFPWERRVAVAFAVPAIALTFVRYVVPHAEIMPYLVAYHLSIVLFAGFAVAVMVRDIFRFRAMSFDAVLGAFAGYLLLGVAWGALYALVHLLAPGAFSVNPEIRWQLDAGICAARCSIT